MQELDQYLGAYPYDSYRKWVSLTNSITPPLLHRIYPVCGQISSVTLVPSSGDYKDDHKMEVDEQKLDLSFEQKVSRSHSKDQSKININLVPGELTLLG